MTLLPLVSLRVPHVARSPRGRFATGHMFGWAVSRASFSLPCAEAVSWAAPSPDRPRHRRARQPLTAGGGRPQHNSRYGVHNSHLVSLCSQRAPVRNGRRPRSAFASSTPPTRRGTAQCCPWPVNEYKQHTTPCRVTVAMQADPRLISRQRREHVRGRSTRPAPSEGPAPPASSHTISLARTRLLVHRNGPDKGADMVQRGDLKIDRDVHGISAGRRTSAWSSRLPYCLSSPRQSPPLVASFVCRRFGGRYQGECNRLKPVGLTPSCRSNAFIYNHSRALIAEVAAVCLPLWSEYRCRAVALFLR
jgi:hypothetical protein